MAKEIGFHTMWQTVYTYLEPVPVAVVVEEEVEDEVEDE